MTEIAKAYVQIIPTTKNIGSNLKQAMGGEVDAAGAAAGESFGGKFAGTMKKALAAAGIGKIISDALGAGGNLQQSYGGLETIYGEAADQMKVYAAAASEAGISANSYAEQAVSFGASLKQAFGGDTVAAANAANTAILDMADNSAKMGTSLEMIQNAYQGFAKQNYTMLDNLKLGYGGTKTEMERLLADATKLTGVKYDISNLGDVYEAIHVIQGELGLTGVAAYEAESTLTGSANATKAAWQNVLAAMTTGGDLAGAMTKFMTSARNLIYNNLAPMIQNLVATVPQVIGNLGNLVIESLGEVSSHTGEIVSWVGEVITSLATAFIDLAPRLAVAAFNLALSLSKALLNYDWVGAASNLIDKLKTSFSNFATAQFGSDTSVIDGIVAGITNMIPTLVSTASQLVTTILNTIISNLPQILSGGVELVGHLVLGLLQALPSVVEGAGQLIRSVIDAFTSVDWSELGANIVNGIIGGLGNLLPNLVESAKNLGLSALNTAKRVLGIASPSKEFAKLGAFTAEGFAEGISDNSGVVNKAAAGIADVAESELSGSYQLGMVAGTGSANAARMGGQSDSGLVSALNHLTRLLTDLQTNGIPAVTYLDGKAVSTAVTKYQRRAIVSGAST